MKNCTGCNEPIDNYPAGAYGGAWYSSCDVCEWHSEGEGHSIIKQGLTLEELVAHKKQLNMIRTMVFNLWKHRQPQELMDIMNALYSTGRELITEE